MRIENTVEVDAPLDRVWALVNDIPRVAPCMPGAALTGVLDDQTYEGTVAVKLGPLRMSYKGKVTVEEVDEANHSARLAASGRDTKGAGTARASVQTRLEPVGDTRTRLLVTSDVQLTGKVASFGRGGAINDVATRLFGQFADCLRATLESEPAGAATGGAAAAPGAATATAGAATADAATVAGAGGEAATAGAGTEVGSGTGAGAGTAAGDGAGGTAAADQATSGPAGTTPAPATQPATGTTEPGTGAAATQAAATGGAGGAGAAGAAGTSAGTSQPAPMTPGAAPGTPAPTPPARVEALDAGSLVGTVIKGRLAALWQAVAGFFRRLFGRRRSPS